jgi:hypothetical protein
MQGDAAWDSLQPWRFRDGRTRGIHMRTMLSLLCLASLLLAACG